MNPQTQTQQPRIVFLDYLRIFACFLVMLVHASENFYGAAGSTDMAGPQSFLANETDRLWVSLYDGFSRMSVPLFIIVSAIMFLAIAVLFLTIREPKLTAENQALEKQHPEWNLAQDDGSGHETHPKPVKKSLGFLLASIALWFIGYNGVTTWFSTYVDTVMG